MSASAADLPSLNATLAAGLTLTRYELASVDDGFRVTLTLTDRDGAKLVLICRDVQNLELLPEGDTLSKPMRLQVTDMREDRLDRVSFSVEELDRDTLFLHCAGLSVEG